MSYSETDDHALTFEIFSYLLFCQREEIEMAAFHTLLAKKMELKLPLILQGFFGSKMRENFDQNMEIFFNNGLNDEQTELPHPGKYLSKFDKLGSSGSNAHRA